MKKVFVTGGTGFIGQALIRRLLKDGWQVTALARSRKRAKETRVKWCFSDVRETDWYRFVRGADVFIHLVGIHGFRRLPWQERLSIELQGTKSAVKAAKKAKVAHFLHFSTAYTDLGTDYAQAKRLTQNWIKQETKKGLPATIICPVTVYGPGDLSNLHRLFMAVAKGKFFFVGNGQNSWRLIYIGDLVEAVTKILAKGEEAVGKAFILAHPQSVPFGELVQMIAREAGVPSPQIHLPRWPMLVMGQIFSSFSRVGLPVPFTVDTIRIITAEQHYSSHGVEKMFGFRPKTNLRMGIKKTVEWYQDRGII